MEHHPTGGIAKMTYDVGVDLGTTYTAAAVARGGEARMFPLGSRASAIPSVVLLRSDGTVLTGEAAERRAVTEPERVAREFKRRLGDSTPILVAGSPYSAEALSGRLLRSVLDEVTRREGTSPRYVAVAHPANWGPYKLDLLSQGIRLAGLDAQQVGLISEPVAAAVSYATAERIEPGELVGVYDLGGGTFDAAILRRTAEGFEVVGRPEGIERLGGIDFDAAVLGHVSRSLGGALEDLDPDDPAAMAAVARLRADAVDGKEALSADTDITIPVLLPNIQTEVRLTRTEFEQLIRPSLVDSLDAMQRAFRTAGLDANDVSKVLLVGGSSRIPLVGQMVASELGRPVAVDAHPKHAIALGASLAAPSLVPVVHTEAETPSPVSAAPPRLDQQDHHVEPTVEDTESDGRADRDTESDGRADRDAELDRSAAVAASLAPDQLRGPSVDQVGTRQAPERLVKAGPGGDSAAPQPEQPTAVARGTEGRHLPPTEPASPAPPERQGSGDGSRAVLVGVLGVLALLVVVGGVWAATRGDGDSETAVAGESVSDSSTSTTSGDSTTTSGADGSTTTADAYAADAGQQVADAEAAIVALGIERGVEVADQDGSVVVSGYVNTDDELTEVTDAVVASGASDADFTGLVVLPAEQRCSAGVKEQETWVCIYEASFDGTNVVADYDTFTNGEALSIQEGWHLHFFSQDIGIENGGVGGTGPWLVWEDDSLSAEPAQVFPDGVVPEQICARMAFAGVHTINEASGNCWPIETTG